VYHGIPCFLALQRFDDEMGTFVSVASAFTAASAAVGLIDGGSLTADLCVV